MRTVRLGVRPAPAQDALTMADLRTLAEAVLAWSGTSAVAVERIYPDLRDGAGSLLILIRGGVSDEEWLRRAVAELADQVAPARFFITL